MAKYLHLTLAYMDKKNGWTTRMHPVWMAFCFRGLICSLKWTFWNLKSELFATQKCNATLMWEAPKPILPDAFNSVDALKCMDFWLYSTLCRFVNGGFVMWMCVYTQADSFLWLQDMHMHLELCSCNCCYFKDCFSMLLQAIMPASLVVAFSVYTALTAMTSKFMHQMRVVCRWLLRLLQRFVGFCLLGMLVLHNAFRWDWHKPQ